MKNVIVANFPPNGSKASELLTLIRAQSVNTKNFGWREDDFIIVSNHDKCCDFGTWIKADINKFCYTGSKLFAVKHLFEKAGISDSIWAHDLDAWQNSELVEPSFLDAGFSHYSRPKINGGSQFWKKSGLDIINDAVFEILKSKSAKEEPILQAIYPKYKNRITILNETYNVGCSGFVERFERATKPIQVCHFHPTNRIAWQSHRLDRNGLGYVSVSPELEKTIRAFYNPQSELDKEGKIAQKRKIEARKK